MLIDLQQEAESEGETISVETEAGTVTLTRHVSSWEQRKPAEHAAWAAPRVTKLGDKIIIG